MSQNNARTMSLWGSIILHQTITSAQVQRSSININLYGHIGIYKISTYLLECLVLVDTQLSINLQYTQIYIQTGVGTMLADDSWLMSKHIWSM